MYILNMLHPCWFSKESIQSLRRQESTRPALSSILPSLTSNSLYTGERYPFLSTSIYTLIYPHIIDAPLPPLSAFVYLPFILILSLHPYYLPLLISTLTISTFPSYLPSHIFPSFFHSINHDHQQHSREQRATGGGESISAVVQSMFYLIAGPVKYSVKRVSAVVQSMSYRPVKSPVKTYGAEIIKYRYNKCLFCVLCLCVSSYI